MTVFWWILGVAVVAAWVLCLSVCVVGSYLEKLDDGD